MAKKENANDKLTKWLAFDYKINKENKCSHCNITVPKGEMTLGGLCEDCAFELCDGEDSLPYR